MKGVFSVPPNVNAVNTSCQKCVRTSNSYSSAFPLLLLVIGINYGYIKQKIKYVWVAENINNISVDGRTMYDNLFY